MDVKMDRKDAYGSVHQIEGTNASDSYPNQLEAGLLTQIGTSSKGGSTISSESTLNWKLQYYCMV